VGNVQIARYTTTEDAAEENQRLIEAIFAELRAKDPGGVRNVTLRLGDGRSFLHIALVEDPDVLPRMDGYVEFFRGMADRIDGTPEFTTATVIGSYRLLED
jgi:hypothetical protein